MDEMFPFPVRKSPRIKYYDYSSENYYFVTICTRDKKCIFGQPDQLNELGRIAEQDILRIPNHYDSVTIKAYIVMPNHIHAIIGIGENQGNPSLNTIIGSYKSGVSRKIRKIDPNRVVWQRSYHDHVIRNQSSYEKIWNYVMHNAQKWEDDCFYISDTKL